MSDSFQEAHEIHKRGREFYDGKDYEKALECYIKAHELDGTNPLYLHDAGLMFSLTGYAEKAIEYYEKGLELVKGIDDTVKFWRRLANAWIDCEDTSKGIYYFEKAFAARIDQYGEQHKLVIESHNDLGFAWRRLSQYRKSIEHFEKAIDLNIAIHGKDHTDTADSYYETGESFYYWGDYTKAVLYHEKALAVRLNLYGAEHSDVAWSWNCLGLCWWKLADHNKAIDYFEKALTSDLKTHGEEHHNVATRWNNLGLVWNELGEGLSWGRSLIC